MVQLDVHEAQTSLAQLLELVERGEEVIVTRHGKLIARLVLLPAKANILGMGAGDPNYRSGLSDEQTFSPMSAQEAEVFYKDCL